MSSKERVKRQKKDEDVESGGRTGHPEEDQFPEGKIGSGYMSTISGQPNLQDFVQQKGPGEKTLNKVKNKPEPEKNQPRNNYGD